MNETIILLRSRLKVQILTKLSEEDLSPVMLSKLLKKPRASISRTMAELVNLKLVICTNPKKDRWRFYKITKEGKMALESIKRYS